MTRSPTFQRRNVYGALTAGALALAALVPMTADAGQAIARFDGGIGETPVSNITTPNAPNGILPGGQPWVISALHATVDDAGNVRADGRGLLLAGGNGIGTNGAQSVKVIFFCNGPGSRSDSDPAGVPLEANGDFRIDSQLTPTPVGPCNTPVLLITNIQNRWFAAGIPK